MVKLGQRIKEVRERNGMEAQELAKRVGVTKGTISNIERGVLKNVPDPDILRSLSRETGISMTEFLVILGYLDPVESNEDESPAVAALRPVLNRYDFDEQDIEHIRYTIEGLGRWMNKRT